MYDEPAWYTIRSDKKWVRYINLIHWPYSLWHLSYVVIGAALAPEMNWGVLGWTLLAFALAMVMGAHALDLIKGDPLKTGIPRLHLVLLAIFSITGAIAIGAIAGVKETPWVIPCIIFGGAIVILYNMELFHGFFHNAFWFAFAWGAFPAITSYIAQTHILSPVIGLGAAACLIYSVAQRVLSKQDRFWRRRVTAIEGCYYEVPNYPVVPSIGYPKHTLTKRDIIQPVEVALKYMTFSIVVAAVGLMLIHI